MATPLANTGGTAASALPAAGGTSESTLSSWAGPYVTNMLGKAQAVASEPYQVYQGPMTAGQSNLQSKVFQGLGGLSFPGNLGQSFSSGMGRQQPQMQPQTMPAYAAQQPMGMPMRSPADIAFEQQFAQQSPSVGGVANAVNAPASSLVQQNDPFYQSPEYKQFESESEGRIGTMDMYDSPNFGLIGSGTTGRAMDEAYGKYKAGLPAQAETPAFNQLDPSSQMVYAGGSKDFDFRGGGYGDTPEDLGVPYNPANFRPPPSMDGVGQTGMPQQGGIASLTPPPPQGSQQPSNIAQSYMNPYLQSVLNPQMDELRRQNEITNMQANAKLTGAGAFGGGRQAIMNAENNRNLMQEMNKTVGQGYASAYDKAMGQFNTEQGQSKDLVNMLANAGQAERGIEQEGITADYNEFLAQRDDPMKKTQYLQSMLQGLPYQTVTNSPLGKSGMGQLAEITGSMPSVEKTLRDLGLLPPA